MVAKGLLAQHGVGTSLGLHLAPGAIGVLAYLFVCVPLATALGLPRQFAFLLMDVLFLFPVLVGLLFLIGMLRNGRISLDGVVLNRRTLPAGRLAALVAALFAWALFVIWLLSPVDDLVQERFFSWAPVALLPETAIAGYPPAVLVATHVLSVAIVGVAAPIVEELYFRGFLLPRVAWMGSGAPVWSTVLFTCYHFWSPWRVVSRILFTLPTTWAVWRTRSISVGIWWHCLGNVAGEAVTFVAVVRTMAWLE